MQEMGEIDVLPQVDEVPVIQACAPDAVCVNAEPELSDEVQRGNGGRGETGNVARIGGDLRLDEDDVKGRAKGPGPEAKRRGRRPGHTPTLTSP
jgi:hypothetical protein